MDTRQVQGRKAQFCNENCASGFKCDREYALIYPSYNVEGEIMSVEDASIACGFCAYCGASEVIENAEA